MLERVEALQLFGIPAHLLEQGLTTCVNQHVDQSFHCLFRPPSLAGHAYSIGIMVVVLWDEAQAHASAPRSVQFFLGSADVPALPFFEDMKFLASPGSRPGRGRIPQRGRRWERNW